MPYLGRPVTNTGFFEVIDDISSGFDGSDVSFTLQVGGTDVLPDASNLTVVLDGVVQIPSSAYSVTGSTINFSEAPESGVQFHCVLAGSSQFVESSIIVDSMVKSTANISGSKINTDFSAQTVKAAIFDGMISGSTQLAADISGSFSKEHLGAKVANVVTSSTQLAADISGSFSKEHLGAKVANVVTSSAQIAADISGSFGNQRVGTSDSPTFAGGTITGDFAVGGTLTAQEVHTEFESASILFTSGSTQFGNSSDDVHDFLGNTISGSATSTGSFGSVVVPGNIDLEGDIDVNGTTNLDVVDIDGAVNISSDSVPQLTIGGGTPTIYLGDSGAEDTKLVFRGNATDVYLALDDSVDKFLIGQGTTVGGDTRIYINPSNGEVTASGNFAITDRLTVGAWDNSNSHGHANINISADANEGADSYLNFAAGTSIKAHIAYDHHAAAQSQQLVIYTADDGTEALRISGSNRVKITQGLLEVGDHGVAGGQIVSDGSLTFNAGYNDSSTGNGDFIFQRYGESTAANTMAQIFSTGNAFFGDHQTQTNSSHFQYASTFGDTSAARVGFFNAASGNSSTDKTLALNIGCMGHGTSAYHPTNMVIASINFLGQANDATYAGGGIDMLVSAGGNIGRTSVGTDMLFRTMDTSSNGGTERMRITKEGNVGIGTTAPTAFYPCLQIEGTQPAVIINDNNSDGFATMIADGGNFNIYFDHSGAIKFLDATNNGGSSGNVEFVFNNNGTAEKASGAGDWAGISDIRVKKNIEDLSIDALNVLNTLRPVEFNWKEEEIHNTPKDSEGKTYGFIADEIESIMPQLVTTSGVDKDSADREYLDEDGMAKKTELGLMASLYIKAIQQLTEKNEALEKRIEELEN